MAKAPRKKCRPTSKNMQFQRRLHYFSKRRKAVMREIKEIIIDSRKFLEHIYREGKEIIFIVASIVILAQSGCDPHRVQGQRESDNERLCAAKALPRAQLYSAASNCSKSKFTLAGPSE